MKHLTFTLLFFVNISVAQITITSADMPDARDTFRFSNANVDSSNFSRTGANYTWNFAQLVPQSQTLRRFQSALEVSFVYLAFGLNAYGEKVVDSLPIPNVEVKNLYDFYQNSSSQFRAVGRGIQAYGAPIPISYSNPDEIYQFPLQYRDLDVSDFSITYNIPNVGTLIQKGTRQNEADGWGTLVTPFATYRNVLRVKTIITREDSVFVNSSNFGIKIVNTTIEYKWLTKEEDIEVMKVTGLEVLGNFVPTSITYRDRFRDIAPQPFLQVNANFLADATRVKVNDLVTLNDATTNFPLFWKWTISPSTFTYEAPTDSTQRNPKVRFTAPGIYTVTLDVNNIITSDVETKINYILVTNTTSTETLALQEAINVYPNPTSNILNIQLPDNQKTVLEQLEVFDVKGSTIITKKVNNESNFQLDVQDLPSGMYVLRLFFEDGMNCVKPFLIK